MIIASVSGTGAGTAGGESVPPVVREMRAYATMKANRDYLIRKGLKYGIPVWKIAEEMRIDRKIVSKIKKEDEG
jgi:hypothetical protein